MKPSRSVSNNFSPEPQQHIHEGERVTWHPGPPLAIAGAGVSRVTINDAIIATDPLATAQHPEYQADHAGDAARLRLKAQALPGQTPAGA